MGETQLPASGGQPAPETTMRRPEGVIASAPSEARIATVPTMSSMSSMTFKRRMAQPAPLSAHRNVERSPYGTLESPRPFLPAKHNASFLGLTEAQMMQITGNRCQDDSHVQNPWKYNDRWGAQPVLDFLYLGPSKMATDFAFLQEQKITKMVSIRDSRFADVRMLMYDKLAASMGIRMECVDVPTTNALLTAIPQVVQSINHHMLLAPVDSNGASTGRVLVFCETGNIRSAAVVLAYIMSMYGESIHDCWHFASLKRFCISLDDDAKQMLIAYEQLFEARRDVHAAHDEAALTASAMVATNMPGDNAMGIANAPKPDLPSIALDWHRSSGEMPDASPAGPVKRGIEETMDVDDDRVEFARSGVSGMPSREPSAEPSALNLDHARYENRGKFVPFIDTGSAGTRN